MASIKQAIGLVGLATVISGCAFINPTDPYDGMTRYWIGETGRGVESPGQQAKGLVKPDGPVSLAQAVHIALANNPDIAARQHEVEAAVAQKEVAVGEALPHVSFETGYSRYLNDQRLVPPGTNGQLGVFGRNIVSGDLVVRMPLFTGGRITSQIKAAELLAKAAEHQLGRSREELVFNVSSLYFNILAQRHVIESLRFSQRALKQHLERVDHLIAAQRAAQVDRLRTLVRLANIEQQIVAQRNVQAVQKQALGNLLGLTDTHSPLEVQGELTMERVKLPDLMAAMRQAMAQREDFLAARAALEAQAKAVDAARAAQWPTIYGQASYGGRWAADPSTQPAGTDRVEDVGQIGVMAEIPIFQGGQIEARIRRERAKLSAARQRLRQLGLQIQLDVKTALLNIQSAYERVQATRTAIDQATESLRIEQEKYDQGKGSITDVLDAQASLLLTQTSYYKALAAYNVALAQYRLAIGEPLE